MNPVLTVDVHFAPADRRQALEIDVRAGLTARPKVLRPVWFYDERGSRLFDEITRLPEYYLTRAERSILTARAQEIARLAGAGTLVELGSGTSEKTTLLLDAMEAIGTLHGFVPFDVSEETLREAAAAVGDRYRIPVRAVVGDFQRHLGELPRDGRRMVAFLGSTIGNLVPAERRRFLADLCRAMDSGDTLLLGTDLVKDRGRLLAAYDDSAGVTAEFNRNILRVLDAELGATFDVDAFEHVARWNEAEARIEMWLRSTVDQVVRVRDLGLTVPFAAGEEMRTETSAKFTLPRVARELSAAGLAVERTWTDEEGDFALTLARRP